MHEPAFATLGGIFVDPTIGFNPIYSVTFTLPKVLPIIQLTCTCHVSSLVTCSLCQILHETDRQAISCKKRQPSARQPSARQPSARLKAVCLTSARSG